MKVPNLGLVLKTKNKACLFQHFTDKTYLSYSIIINNVYSIHLDMVVTGFRNGSLGSTTKTFHTILNGASQ